MTWLLWIFPLLSFSQTNVCESLSNLACAPGKYKDGTGQVPSESEIERNRAEQEKKARLFFEAEFKKVLQNPDNEFFKESAKQSFSLTDSPQCNSKNAEDVKDCNDNLIEGLTNLAAKVSFNSRLERLGDLEAVTDLSQNHIFADIIERSRLKAKSDLNSDPLLAKIKNQTMPQMKNLFIKKINSFPLTTEQKKLMASKIKSLSFAGDDCSAFGNNINAMFVPNAFYQPLSHTVRYCTGMAIRSSSDFTLGMIIAHEIAHSIDPCVLPMGLPARNQFGKNQNDEASKTVLDLDQQTPLKNLIFCLRNERSIGAKNITPEKPLTPPASEGNPSAAGKSEKPPKSLCADQIGESFCDWMAAELISEFIKNNHKLTTAQYINGYGNAFRPLCSSPNTENSDQEPRRHPHTTDRIDKILLVNPSVRKDMGCPEEHSKNIYCTPNSNIGYGEQDPLSPTNTGGRVAE